jgi:hypothetical protein
MNNYLFNKFTDGNDDLHIKLLMKPKCNIIKVDYFEQSKHIKEFEQIFDIFNNHKDSEKTDYLCDYNSNVCIYNVNAKLLRKIYDKHNYKSNEKHIFIINR